MNEPVKALPSQSSRRQNAPVLLSPPPPTISSLIRLTKVAAANVTLTLTGRLDLGGADATGADAAAATAKHIEHGRDGEGGKAEPLEGGHGLGLVAALALVVLAGLAQDVVAVGVALWTEMGQRVEKTGESRTTYTVAAAVDANFGSEGDGNGEPEDGKERVDTEQDEGVAGDALLDGCRDEVEEGQHADDGAEHGVVDDSRRATVGLGDHCDGSVSWSCFSRREKQMDILLPTSDMTSRTHRNCRPRMAMLMMLATPIFAELTEGALADSSCGGREVGCREKKQIGWQRKETRTGGARKERPF